MIPGSAGALAILVALIPGFFFLRLTESVRKPSEQTAFQEIAEVLTVGLLTTGLTICGSLLFWPSEVVATASAPFNSGRQVREAVLLLVAIVAIATLAALLAAGVRHALAGQKRYAPNVWESVFSEVKPGYLRHVTFELTDGRTIDGPIKAYTVTPGVDGGKQLALQGTIRVTKPGESLYRSMPWDYVVVEDSSIQYAALTHMPDGNT